MLDTLHAHHEAILAVALHLEALVKADVPDTAALAKARAKVAELSNARTILLDRMIYPDLLRHVGDGDAARLARLRDDRIQILAAVAKHARAWSTERIAAEWAQYQQVFTLLLIRLRLRIGAEKAILPPLIEWAGRHGHSPLVEVEHGFQAAWYAPTPSRRHA